MNIKTRVALLSSKLTKQLLKLARRSGTTLPGKVALKIDPKLLSHVSKNVTTILITGTNGKSTTTSMITKCLRDANYTVFSNESGANMIQGITGCFIDHYSDAHQYAIIEVDEATLKHVTTAFSPDYLLITNLFRDQMDRYGEVTTTLSLIVEGIKKAPNMTLLLNGDDPIFNHLNLPNKIKYYGVENNPFVSVKEENIDSSFCKLCRRPLSYQYINYAQLGLYECECGNHRPLLDYKVERIDTLNSDMSVFSVNNQSFQISTTGMYNVYNALAAIVVTRELEVPLSKISTSLATFDAKFGRQQKLIINNKHITFYLIKNPAGFNQSIANANLDDQVHDSIFMINDQYADGIDISWLFDVNMSALKHLNTGTIITSGLRAYDMAIRLKIDGIEHIEVIQDFNQLLESIETMPHDCIDFYWTYTAMTEFRRFLSTRGMIDHEWR